MPGFCRTLLLVGSLARGFLSVYPCSPTPQALDDLVSHSAKAVASSSAHRIRIVALPNCSQICTEFETRLHAALVYEEPGITFPALGDVDALVNLTLGTAGGIVLHSQIVDLRQRELIGDFNACVATMPRFMRGLGTIYTSEATGIVRFLVSITTEGRTADVVVLDGIDKDVEQLVLKAVRDWRFAPATRGGTAAREGEPIAVRLYAFIEVKR